MLNSPSDAQLSKNRSETKCATIHKKCRKGPPKEFNPGPQQVSQNRRGCAPPFNDRCLRSKGTVSLRFLSCCRGVVPSPFRSRAGSRSTSCRQPKLSPGRCAAVHRRVFSTCQCRRSQRSWSKRRWKCRRRIGTDRVVVLTVVLPSCAWTKLLTFQSSYCRCKLKLRWCSLLTECDTPGVMPGQDPKFQKVPLTVEVPLVQSTDQFVDVEVAMRRHVPTLRAGCRGCPAGAVHCHLRRQSFVFVQTILSTSRS